MRLPGEPEPPSGWFGAWNWRPVIRPIGVAWLEAEQLSIHPEYTGPTRWWRATVEIEGLRCMYNTVFCGAEMAQGDRFVDVVDQASKLHVGWRCPSALVYRARDGHAYIADGNHRTAAGWRRGLTTVEAMVVCVREHGWRPHPLPPEEPGESPQ